MRGHISCKIIDRDVGNLVRHPDIEMAVISVQGVELSVNFFYNSVSLVFLLLSGQISAQTWHNTPRMLPFIPNYLLCESRARIFKLLRNPRIDSKESIPPAYVAWRVGSTNIFLLGS
jgi:hypothetical protein